MNTEELDTNNEGIKNQQNYDFESILKKMDFFQRVFDNVITDDDWQAMGGNKSLTYPGYRKLGVALDISESIISGPTTIYNEDGTFSSECRVSATLNGRTIEAFGSCSVKEKCCKQPCKKRSYSSTHTCCPADCTGESHFANAHHDVPATAETRAKKRAIADLIGVKETQKASDNTNTTNVSKPSKLIAKPVASKQTPSQTKEAPEAPVAPSKPLSQEKPAKPTQKAPEAIETLQEQQIEERGDPIAPQEVPSVEKTEQITETSKEVNLDAMRERATNWVKDLSSEKKTKAKAYLKDKNIKWSQISVDELKAFKAYVESNNNEQEETAVEAVEPPPTPTVINTDNDPELEQTYQRRKNMVTLVLDSLDIPEEDRDAKIAEVLKVDLGTIDINHLEYTQVSDILSHFGAD